MLIWCRLMVQEENVKGCGGEDGGKARGSAQWGGLAGGGGEGDEEQKTSSLGQQ